MLARPPPSVRNERVADHAAEAARQLTATAVGPVDRATGKGACARADDCACGSVTAPPDHFTAKQAAGDRTEDCTGRAIVPAAIIAIVAVALVVASLVIGALIVVTAIIAVVGIVTPLIVTPLIVTVAAIVVLVACQSRCYRNKNNTCGNQC